MGYLKNRSPSYLVMTQSRQGVRIRPFGCYQSGPPFCLESRSPSQVVIPHGYSQASWRRVPGSAIQSFSFENRTRRHYQLLPDQTSTTEMSKAVTAQSRTDTRPDKLAPPCRRLDVELRQSPNGGLHGSNTELPRNIAFRSSLRV